MKRFSQLAVPYIAWAVMMLILPMGLIALYSVTEQGNSIISFTFTLEHYAKFFTDPDFLIVLWRSLLIALKTTVICLLLGYPIAYFISRSSEKIQNLLVLVITIPMWINMLVRTYAWIGLLSEGGLIQRLLSLIGLGGGELLYTEGAVLLGMVYNFLPFMVLQINTAPDLCQGDASDVTAGCHQRHYARLSAGSQLVLYSEAARRRPVFPDRQPDRESVHYGRRVELRKCNLDDHGSYHDASDDGCAQSRDPQQRRKGGVDR